MRVRRGNHVSARSVYLRVNRECRSIYRAVALDDLAAMVHQNQVRRADLAEMHPERIYPEMVQPFRVAGRDVAGHSFIKCETRKQAKCGGKHALVMQTLLGRRGKFRWLGNAWSPAGGPCHFFFREPRTLS